MSRYVEQPVNCETTLKSDDISLPMTTKPKISQSGSSKLKADLLKKIKASRAVQIKKSQSLIDLISIDNLTKEVEAQGKRLSPADCAKKIVGTNQYWEYTKLNAEYLKYHEDNPNEDPRVSIVRSKPDENFKFKEMPRDITALFVSLKMQQKIDAKRKF